MVTDMHGGELMLGATFPDFAELVFFLVLYLGICKQVHVCLLTQHARYRRGCWHNKQTNKNLRCIQWLDLG